jgi:hypothetical protein
VELGSIDHKEDLIYGSRNSVDSISCLESHGGAKKKDKAKNPTRISVDDLSLTPSVERYIADLVEDLSKITVPDSDITTEQPGPSFNQPLELKKIRQGTITNLPFIVPTCF